MLSPVFTNCAHYIDLVISILKMHTVVFLSGVSFPSHTVTTHLNREQNEERTVASVTNMIRLIFSNEDNVDLARIPGKTC